MVTILLSALPVVLVVVLAVIGTRRPHSQVPARIDTTSSDRIRGTSTTTCDVPPKNLITNLRWSINE